MFDIKDLKANIRTIIENENILTYLDIVTSNPSLSYLNQMLLFAQGKRAEVVCGRGAWEAMGRTIKEDATMLHIIYPAIVITEEGMPYKENDKFICDEETDIQFMIKQSKFDIRYLVMGAYAYGDTDGKEIEERPTLEHILDRIATITEPTPEITDKELKLGIKYVVLKYFGCDITNINPKLFGLLRKRTDEELVLFCRELQYFSWKAVNELQEIPTLNFDETAFINELLYSDRKDDLYCLFDNVIASIDYADPEGLNDDIKEELANLRHKISLLDADNIQEMYIQKQRNQIFTYPATPIRYDLNTYLKRK